MPAASSGLTIPCLPLPTSKTMFWFSTAVKPAVVWDCFCDYADCVVRYHGNSTFVLSSPKPFVNQSLDRFPSSIFKVPQYHIKIYTCALLSVGFILFFCLASLAHLVIPKVFRSFRLTQFTGTAVDTLADTRSRSSSMLAMRIYSIRP